MPRDIALLIGSLRKDSYNRKVGNALIELAPGSLQIHEVPIGDLPLYDQDLDTATPPQAWRELRDRLRTVDGVLFATPEYNRSIPGALKNAVDVGSRPYGQSVWTGKPCAVISASPGAYGAFGANHHLRQCFVFLDMHCMQQPETYLSRVDKMFDDAGKLADAGAKDVIVTFIGAFAAWVERFAPTASKRSAA